jgi:PiT family inorganic phosphate transporter
MQGFLEEGLAGGRIFLTLICLAIAFGFEFVNGFHDTANAVATVIYTHSLRPQIAVLVSGTFNFMGVFLGGIGVALGIMKLLPVELLVSSGAGAGLAMVLALLISAILWNLGTWYFGLPASSSHTLIGAIIGVGLAHSLVAPGHKFGDGVNWSKAEEVGFSLLLSPVVGFCLAALLLLLLKALIKTPSLYEPPPKDKQPPAYVRWILRMTCAGVSFAHGMNDGQKGVGLVMLILMGLMPAGFALDQAASGKTIAATIEASTTLATMVREHTEKSQTAEADKAIEQLAVIRTHLAGRTQVADIPREERFQVRQAILLGDKSIDTIVKKHAITLSPEDMEKISTERHALRAVTDYAPRWVLVAIALSLGVGTMVGWKRIVVTVGEKIGKSHLTYAQGASAELVAMGTIGLSSYAGLPVSTTHVLSSGIAGTMVAQKSGLQVATVRAIALAWVMTLPVAMALSAVLFLGFRTVLASPNEARHVVVVPSDDEPLPPPPSSMSLRLTGSNTIGEHLAPSLAKAFLERQGAASVVVGAKDGQSRVVVHGTLEGKPISVEILAPGSKFAFECLANDTCDVGMASRSIHADEAQTLKGLGDMTTPACEHVLGQDGVAVIVNKTNVVQALSFDQLAGIFTGKITDWSSVGGAPGTIKVLTRDNSSGTFDTFSTLVAKGAALKPAEAFEDSEKLSAGVSADPLAIGFIGLPYVKEARALAVRDGDARAMYPTVFTVATEDYPLTRRLYLYTSDDPKNPLASAFTGFAQSDEGQRIVEASGFVSLSLRTERPTVPASAPAAYTKEIAGAARLSVDFRFRTGGVSLDTKALRDVDRVVSFLSLPANRTHAVLLFGFADNQGSEAVNQGLSVQRAEGIRSLLTQRGVTPAVVTGFGSAMPIAPNSTSDGRERNRRVEVWVR